MTDYLAILDLMPCPVCRTPLSDWPSICHSRQIHCKKRTQREAMKALRLAYCLDKRTRLDDRLIEIGKLPRPAHRPRLNPRAVRVTAAFRLDPSTLTKIEAEGARTGEGSGRVIDRLAASLPG